MIDTYNLDEAWVGLKATKRLPRTTSDRQYFSNSAKMTDPVFEKVQQDDGGNSSDTKLFSKTGFCSREQGEWYLSFTKTSSFSDG